MASDGPLHKAPAQEKPYLYKNECCFSELFYTFGKKVLDLGKKKGFGFEDLFPVKEEWVAETLYSNFEKRFARDSKSHGFKYAVLKQFMGKFFYAVFLWMLGTAIGMLAPIAIKRFVDWLKSPKSRDIGNSGDGWVWGCVIIAAALCKLMLKRRSMFVGYINQYEIGVSLKTMIYSKFNQISTEAIRNLDIGKIANSISSDIWQIQMAMRVSPTLFVSPALLLGITAYLWVVFNWISLVIPLTFSSIILFQLLINRFTTKAIRQKKEMADKRTKFMNEIITGIKNIKFQAWEAQALQRIEAIRAKECALLRKFINLNLLSNHISDCGSSLCSLAFFYFYKVVYGGKLDLAETYMIISFINQLHLPTRMLTMAFDLFVNAKIALNRIERVMLTPNKASRPEDKSLRLGEVKFEHFSGGWFSKEQTDFFKANQDKVNSLAVSDVSYTFEPGKLYAILGPVGSGKSSILLAILDDPVTKSGSIASHGSIAYIGQSAFLLNASVKQNIIFHSEFDEARYKDCLIRSCLLEDIKTFPGGDQTEIGERGINLSGGQKQRITIARAMYANKDIYLVDDCLSALDAEVGKKIFYDVLKRQLKGKTIIMVTHSTSILQDVDRILLLNNGCLVLEGEYDEIKKDSRYLDYYYQSIKETEGKPASGANQAEPVLSKSKPPGPLVSAEGPLEEYRNLTPDQLRAKMEEEEKEYREQTKKLEELFIEISEKQREALKKKGALIKAETRSLGMVNFRFLCIYLKAYSMPRYALYLFAGCNFVGGRMFGDYWMGQWAKDETSRDRYFAFWYAILNLALFAIILCMSTTHAFGMRRGSYRINHQMTQGIMKNRIEFFDTTPVGVILNRFTKDVEIMDQNLSNFISQFQFNFLQISGIFLLMMVTVPVMIVFVVLAILLFARIAKSLLVTSSDMRRMGLVSGSPIISNISEALAGCLPIRTYGVFDKLKSIYMRNLGKVSQIEITERVMGCYVFHSIELISVALLASIIVLIVLIRGYRVKLFQDPNILALCINWVSISTEWIGNMLFQYQELNSGINCIERLVDMSIPINEEPPYDTPLPPTPNWPTQGTIQLSNVSIRYRASLPCVLKNISLQITNKEKVGIVGRTGSGKSTLILALKRMLEIEPFENSFIKVDGARIDSMGIKFYRAAIVLIPQDPFLLSGSVKSNIDPDGCYSDADIEAILRKTQIFDNIYDTINRVVGGSKTNTKDSSPLDGPVATEAQGLLLTGRTKRDEVLNYEVKEGGSNLSQGQRQLLCIARAIICRPKILLMDEATANIDSKTDQTIQKIIKNEFKDSTVITIAHRLNTIIQYDRVVVMANGEIVDQGSPAGLLEKEGIFRELVMELGENNFNKMKQFANDLTLDPILD